MFLSGLRDAPQILFGQKKAGCVASIYFSFHVRSSLAPNAEKDPLTMFGVDQLIADRHEVLIGIEIKQSALSTGGRGFGSGAAPLAMNKRVDRSSNHDRRM
jgi:hypothetical protein